MFHFKRVAALTVGTALLAMFGFGCGGGDTADTGAPGFGLFRITSFLGRALRFEIRSDTRGPIGGAAIYGPDANGQFFFSTLTGTEEANRFQFGMNLGAGVGNVSFDGTLGGNTMNGTYSGDPGTGPFQAIRLNEQTPNYIGTWRGPGTYILYPDDPELRQTLNGTLSVSFTSQSGNRISGAASFTETGGGVLVRGLGTGVAVGDVILIIRETQGAQGTVREVQTLGTLQQDGRLQVEVRKAATTGGSEQANAPALGQAVLTFIGS